MRELHEANLDCRSLSDAWLGAPTVHSVRCRFDVWTGVASIPEQDHDEVTKGARWRQ
jgi:hypothetical protein